MTKIHCEKKPDQGTNRLQENSFFHKFHPQCWTPFDIFPAPADLILLHLPVTAHATSSAPSWLLVGSCKTKQNWATRIRKKGIIPSACFRKLTSIVLGLAAEHLCWDRAVQGNQKDVIEGWGEVSLSYNNTMSHKRGQLKCKRLITQMHLFKYQWFWKLAGHTKPPPSASAQLWKFQPKGFPDSTLSLRAPIHRK